MLSQATTVFLTIFNQKKLNCLLISHETIVILLFLESKNLPILIQQWQPLDKVLHSSFETFPEKIRWDLI